MIIGRIPQPLDAATDMPWAKPFRFWRGQTKGDPLAVAGASARVRLRGCEAPPAMELTVSDGRVIIDENTVNLRLSAADMALIGFGTFDLELTVVLEDGSGRRILATLEVARPI